MTHPSLRQRSFAVVQDSIFSYIFTASDVDKNETLSYTAITKPSWLSINSTTGVLSGKPSALDVGTHTVVPKASDKSGMATTKNLTITVLDKNDAPLLQTLLQTSILIRMVH